MNEVEAPLSAPAALHVPRELLTAREVRQLQMRHVTCGGAAGVCQNAGFDDKGPMQRACCAQHCWKDLCFSLQTLSKV